MINWWVKDVMEDVGNGYYQSLHKRQFAKSETHVDPALKQIDLDLTRTLPTNKNFASMEASKIEALRRVLYAFRWHNQDIGYCQASFFFTIPRV